ncbi:hypothetical protein PsorP6_002745 [Peronosclerospora sorghi]|uniref:Uncharacterized protein n=1 Tax=Peronosclerospora sorghi TaxID=230839 RepID=A0ACC0WVE7_9STRA|nr:hypothetical protein PsorP6_002745 [Peronosclerospora sorghi]
MDKDETTYGKEHYKPLPVKNIYLLFQDIVDPINAVWWNAVNIRLRDLPIRLFSFHHHVKVLVFSQQRNSVSMRFSTRTKLKSLSIFVLPRLATDLCHRYNAHNWSSLTQCRSLPALSN